MFSERLRLARKRAGLSLRELSDKIGNEVSHQAIKKYEDGDMYPNSRVLVSLSRALGVSIDFLMSNQVEGLAGIEFRKHSGTTQKDRARIEAAVIEAVERYLEVEGALELEDVEVDLGELPGQGPIIAGEDAEQRADCLRALWNLGGDPIPSMTALLEERGFKVIEVDLPAGVDGLTCKVERGGEKPPLSVIIVGRNNTTIERRRFTLAHELAHKVMPDIGKEIETEKEKERLMHRFSGAFLMPGEHLKAEIGSTRHAFAYRELIQLKHHYGVSAASFLMRLLALGMVSSDAVTTAFRTYARTWKTNEPEPLALSASPRSETPMRFQQLVYRAIAEQMISLPRAAELLNQPMQEVENQVRGPAARHADHRQ